MLRKTLAVLALIAGLSTVALAQTPPSKEKPGEPKQKKPVAVVSAEEAIETAFRSHPDVRVAEARVRVAEAELAQAKLLVAQRVAAAQSSVQRARVELDAAEKTMAMLKNVDDPTPEHNLARAKAALAAAEADLRTAQGLAPGAVTREPTPLYTLRMHQFLNTMVTEELKTLSVPKAPLPGSNTDRLRLAADRRVALDLKKPVPFNTALDTLVKSAGLEGVTLRAPEWASEAVLREPPLVGPLVGEQTTAAWLQLLLDDFNRSVAAGKVLPGNEGKYDAYVRDYGLLITRIDLAPPGALTFAEFVRATRTEKASDNPK